MVLRCTRCAGYGASAQSSSSQLVPASLPFPLEFSPGISPSGSALSPFHGQCLLSSLGPSPGPRLPPRAPAHWLASSHIALWFAGCPCVRPDCGPSSARCRPGILWMLLLPPPKPSSSRKCKQPYPCGGGILAKVLALNLVQSVRRSHSRKGQSHPGTQPWGRAEGPAYGGVSLTRVQAGQPGSRPSSAEVGRLQKACSLLRLRMREELMAG